MKNLTERISNLRNAQRSGRKQIVFSLPFGAASNSFRRSFFRLLVREGYIDSFSCAQISQQVGSTTFVYTLSLKYGPQGEPTIRDIRSVSTGGRRVYLPVAALWQPQFLNGTLILSTPQGLLTDREARYYGVGGEVIRAIR
jgi:small subunit ribosomal protein S8